MTASKMISLTGGVRIAVAAIAVIGSATVAAAQSNEQTAAQPQQQTGAQTAALSAEDQALTIGQIVEANKAGGVEALTKALSPLIIENPALAATLVDIAKSKPELAETLAEVLARIQKGLKALDPEKAKQIATIIASAPPAFQAAYAVAQSPGDTGGTQTADAGGAAGGGAGAATGGGDGGAAGAAGVGYGGGLSGGGSIGGGGGTVSPASP